jgi:hypothetical protein
MARDRERIDQEDQDSRYVRRNDQGEFTSDQEEVGRSLSQDRKRDAEHSTKKGQGDKGDRREE